MNHIFPLKPGKCGFPWNGPFKFLISFKMHSLKGFEEANLVLIWHCFFMGQFRENVSTVPYRSMWKRLIHFLLKVLKRGSLEHKLRCLSLENPHKGDRTLVGQVCIPDSPVLSQQYIQLFDFLRLSHFCLRDELPPGGGGRGLGGSIEKKEAAPYPHSPKAEASCDWVISIDVIAVRLHHWGG